MNSILLKKILTPTICFLIFFAICPEKSFAQKQYSISGKISVEDGDIENTYFTVYKNAKKLSTEAIALNGRLTYKLDFGNDYLFEFFKDGFVTKKLSISTFVPERILKKDSYFPPFKFQISLFPAYEGLDLSVFDQPMGIVMYDKRLDDFDYDKEYDAQIKDAIKKAEEEARRLAELKALNEKYAKAIEIADGHLKNKDYEISIRSYKQALKIKPKEQYPRDQIIKIENLLAEARKLAALQKLN